MMNQFFGKKLLFQKDYRKKSYFLLNGLTGLVFIFSSISKYLSKEYFYQIIQRYGIMWNDELLRLVANILIAIELFIGISIIIKYDKKWPKILALLIVLIFNLIFLYGYLFKNIQDCGCFGNILLLDVKTTFLKNIILSVLLFYLVFEQKKEIFNLKVSYRWATLLIALIFSFQLSLFLQKPSEKDVITLLRILRETNINIQSYDNDPVVIIIVNPDCEICCDEINTFDWNDWKIIKTIVLINNIPNKNHLITSNIPTDFTKTLISNDQYINLTEQLSPMAFLVRNNKVIGKWERKIPTLDEVLNKI
jgi:uncharacterized membrane protein YphA (DoxX/SURF4 family)